VISRRAYALTGLVLVMLVWGSTYAVTKAAVREIPPLTLAVLRCLIAVSVLVPIAMARGGLLRLARPLPIAPLIWMGFTGIALLTVGFNYGLIYGSATQGALVYALGPAAVAVAAVLGLGEGLSGRRIAGIVLSVAGAALVVVSGEMDRAAPRPWLGAICMFVGVVAWAYYTVIAKRLADADQVVVIACRLSGRRCSCRLPLSSCCRARPRDQRLPGGLARCSWEPWRPPWRMWCIVGLCASWMRVWWVPTSRWTPSSGLGPRSCSWGKR
jgi:drug/metabolite transporter (DMT)-like permease